MICASPSKHSGHVARLEMDMHNEFCVFCAMERYTMLRLETDVRTY
jgi:hypothetical protein